METKEEFRMPIFDENNFPQWKKKIIAYLKTKNVYYDAVRA